MNKLQKTAETLNNYRDYKVIGLVAEKVMMNPKTHDFSELIVTKPILVLEKDKEIIALSFYASQTIRNNLKFYFIEVNPERILKVFNDFNVDDTLMKVKNTSFNFYDELIFETPKTSFSLSVNRKISKQDLIFRYIIRN
jgi:hypothetical protein